MSLNHPEENGSKCHLLYKRKGHCPQRCRRYYHVASLCVWTGGQGRSNTSDRINKRGGRCCETVLQVRHEQHQLSALAVSGRVNPGGL